MHFFYARFAIKFTQLDRLVCGRHTHARISRTVNLFMGIACFQYRRFPSPPPLADPLSDATRSKKSKASVLFFPSSGNAKMHHRARRISMLPHSDGVFRICLYGQLALLTLPRANVTHRNECPLECPFKQMHFDVAHSAKCAGFICTLNSL